MFKLVVDMLTVIHCCNRCVGHWPTSFTVAGRNGAVVFRGWCKPLQCEGTCLCVVHGNSAFPTTLRDTG